MDINVENLMPLMDRIFSFFTEIQWCFFAIISILIFRKPLINFCQRFVSLSFDLMGQKAQIKAVEPTQQVKEISDHIIQEKNIIDEAKPDPEDSKQIENLNSCYVFNIWEAFKNKQPDKAKNIFENYYNDETDKLEKVHIEATYLRLLYTEAGEKSGLIELEQHVKKSEAEEQKRIVLTNLSICYSRAKDYLKVINLWETSIDEAMEESNKTHYICNLANAYINNNQSDIAAMLLESRLKTVSTNQEKTVLYKGISAVEKAKGNKILAALALEKTIEMNPDDKGLLYSSAHLQASTELTHLAANNYDTLISLDSENKSAVNNLGALASDLYINTKGIEFYKKAAELGNILAMSNLANHYLHYGFIDEAKAMIEKAEDLEKSNEDVVGSLARINEKIEKDNKDWNKILKEGNEYREYFRQYTSAYYNENGQLAKFTGEWKNNNQEKFEIEDKDSNIFAEWRVDINNIAIGKGYKLSLIGTTHNNSANIIYKKELLDDQNKGLLRRNHNTRYNCYAYIASDRNRLVIFSIDSREKFLLKLNRCE
ncbi:MAG: hypothetical protein K8R67_02190 [Desulfobacteraceae bacterium]|nr:hypothetical protein [Desulfobacteraceae bacterium]